MSTPIPPVCPWCHELVGDNEYDVESGGYFSAHSRCVNAVKDGTFHVVAYLDGKLYREQDDAPVYGYTHLARAQAHAAYLASFNSTRWDFHVYDREHDSPRATYTGRLERKSEAVA